MNIEHEARKRVADDAARVGCDLAAAWRSGEPEHYRTSSVDRVLSHGRLRCEATSRRHVLRVFWYWSPLEGDGDDVDYAPEVSLLFKDAVTKVAEHIKASLEE